MQVYSLLGFVDYEGQDLVGVFGSVESLLQFVSERRASLSYRPESLGYHQLGYVVSELGQPVSDVYEQVEYL